MKKTLLLFVMMMVTLTMFAQSPNQMSYQAVIRNAAGVLQINQAVGVRIRILQYSNLGGPVFIETHTGTTNANGLLTLKIGSGTLISGNFTTINWGDGPYFLQVEIDPTGGTTYSINNISQMLSVPYALYAKTAGADSTKWSLNGNNAAATNFIGTTNNMPLKFRYYNEPVGQIDHHNVSFGYHSNLIGGALGGIYNAAFGALSLYSNTTGVYNVANGYNALYSNTTGHNNVATGPHALFSNSTGNSNVAVGRSTLYENISGENNTAIGPFTLHKNTIGNNNIAVGNSALFLNVTGNSNVAIGINALYKNETKSNLVAIGDSALYNNGTGATQPYQAVGNTAVGSKALFNNTIAQNNTAFGYLTLYNNTTGNANIAIGALTMYSNNTGHGNTAIGSNSLRSNDNGNYNTVNGFQSLWANISGSNNTSNGSESLFGNTTGNSNVAIGIRALYNNTTKSNLVAIGDSALYNNGNGATQTWEAAENTAVGSKALYANTTGYDNTANGYRALSGNTSGSQNTAIGSYALRNNYTGNSNTAIGYYANVSSGNLTNATVIGYNAVVNASNKVRIGNTAVTKIEGQVAFSFPSDARFKYNIKNNVPGLAFIKKLQPVTYYFDEKKLDEFTKTGKLNNSNIYPAAYSGEREIHTGFLAQDVEKIAAELGYHFDGVRTPTNDKDHYSLAYSQFIMPLVKAVQEQQTIIEQQQQSIEQLNDALKKLEEKLDKLSH